MQFIKYYHAEHYRHILISINVIVVAFEVCMNVLLHPRRKILKNNQWRGLVEGIHLFQLTYRHELSITTFENICITLHLLCIYYASRVRSVVCVCVFICHNKWNKNIDWILLHMYLHKVLHEIIYNHRSFMNWFSRRCLQNSKNSISYV